MSVATSIPDTSLGLTSSEIQILRQQQQIALQGGGGGGVGVGGGGHAGSVSRGRGSGRNSNSSSRATSAASSQGRLLLDPMSLRALSHQLEYLQQQIHHRIEHVSLHPKLGSKICTDEADLQPPLPPGVTVRRPDADVNPEQS